MMGCIVILPGGLIYRLEILTHMSASSSSDAVGVDVWLFSSIADLCLFVMFKYWSWLETEWVVVAPSLINRKNFTNRWSAIAAK